jgi:hypothetical protein
MFKQNKYTKIYYDIITRAKLRVIDGYVEKHHIIPKCIGGDNSDQNIVKLTAREHYICHHLLTKMHDFSGLKYAFILMMVNNPHQERNFKISSKMYEISKRMNSELATEKFKGKQKHNVGKQRWYDPVTKESFMVSSGEENPSWVKGLSSTHKNNMLGKHVGKIYFYNPDNMDVIHIPAVDIPPIGYVRGNPKANTGYTCVGKKNFYCPVTGDSIKTFTCPDGYLPGAVKTWITDGKDNCMVNKVTHIFEGDWVGWRFGRTFNAHKGKIND